MWTTRNVIDWLATLGVGPGLTVDVPVLRGDDYIPDMPDLLVIITMVPGAGEAMEGVTDTPGFQVRVRGKQRQASTAEEVALRIDQLVRFAVFPADAPGNTRLVAVTRSGGRPAPVGSPDAGGRVSYPATYLTTVA